MAHNFYPCERDQPMLMPPSVSDWVSQDHLAHFIVDCVGQLDLRPIYSKFRVDGKGHTAYDPAMLVALLLYSYAIGVRSSRQIERGCAERIPERYISANQFPDHCTIARFRKRFSPHIQDIFVQILRMCNKAQMIKLGTVAIDGTKVEANAAMDSNGLRSHFEQIAKKILEEAEAIDAEQDRQYGEAKRGDEQPDWMRDPAERRKKIRELLQAEKALEKAGERDDNAQDKYDESRAVYDHKKAKGEPCGFPPKRPKPGADMKINTTDFDSRIHVTRHGGHIQGYNCQAAVDADTQVILSADVVDCANDLHQLPHMIEQTITALTAADVNALQTKAVVADAGYWGHRTMEKAIELLKNLLPAGLPDLFVAVPKQFQKLKDLTSPPAQDADIYVQHEYKQRCPGGQRIFHKRARSIEAVFGQIKSIRQFGRFQLRGMANVKSEWLLACLTHNLLKLWRQTKPQSTPKPKDKHSLQALLTMLRVFNTQNQQLA